MAEYRAIEVIAGNAESKVITHSLANVNAVLSSATQNWPGHPFITARASNTITVAFPTPCPAGGGTLDVRVQT